MTNRVRVIVAVALCLTASASWAEAQGNGRGNAYGKRNQGASGGAAAGAAAASAPSGSSPTTETVQGPPAGVGVRNFGAWLDDASVMAPGSGSLTLSVAYWRTPAYREIRCASRRWRPWPVAPRPVRIQHSLLPRKRTRRANRSRGGRSLFHHQDSAPRAVAYPRAIGVFSDASPRGPQLRAGPGSQPGELGAAGQRRVAG